MFENTRSIYLVVVTGVLALLAAIFAVVWMEGEGELRAVVLGVVLGATFSLGVGAATDYLRRLSDEAERTKQARQRMDAVFAEIEDNLQSCALTLGAPPQLPGQIHQVQSLAWETSAQVCADYLSPPEAAHHLLRIYAHFHTLSGCADRAVGEKGERLTELASTVRNHLPAIGEHCRDLWQCMKSHYEPPKEIVDLLRQHGAWPGP